MAGTETLFATLMTRIEVEEQLGSLGRSGGAIAIPDQAWGWALPLRSLEGHVGYFIAGAPEEPSPSAQFLLQVLAQQTGVALANAHLHAKDRATNAALAETVQALRRSTQIHDRFTRVAVAGEGQGWLVLRTSSRDTRSRLRIGTGTCGHGPARIALTRIRRLARLAVRRCCAVLCVRDGRSARATGSWPSPTPVPAYSAC